MAVLKQLHPAPSVPIQIPGIEGYELICTEAGRTNEGLTGSVAPKNGHITGDALRVCWPNPESCSSVRAHLAEQLTKATRVLQGRSIATLDALQPGQEVLFNLTWATLYGPGRTTDLWLDAAARDLATAQQREQHRLYIRDRGLPAIISAVDDDQENVTVVCALAFRLTVCSPIVVPV